MGSLRRKNNKEIVYNIADEEIGLYLEQVRVWKEVKAWS